LHSGHFNENFLDEIFFFTRNGDALDLQVRRFEAPLEKDDALTFCLQRFRDCYFKCIKAVKEFQFYEYKCFLSNKKVNGMKKDICQLLPGLLPAIQLCFDNALLMISKN
jgi:hypothetical protein